MSRPRPLLDAGLQQDSASPNIRRKQSRISCPASLRLSPRQPRQPRRCQNTGTAPQAALRLSSKWAKSSLSQVHGQPDPPFLFGTLTRLPQRLLRQLSSFSRNPSLPQDRLHRFFPLPSPSKSSCSSPAPASCTT